MMWCLIKLRDNFTIVSQIVVSGHVQSNVCRLVLSRSCHILRESLRIWVQTGGRDRVVAGEDHYEVFTGQRPKENRGFWFGS
jgi:hypothetical protein